MKKEQDILERFHSKKILTIDELAGMIDCSCITARRYLKKRNAYTSINQNGRYYTLPDIPKFNKDGLWRFERVLFSKYGNLKTMIVRFINKSDAGLSLDDLSKILGLPQNSSLLSRIHQSGDGIRREKYHGRFFYFSDKQQIYKKQKENQLVSPPQTLKLPTDTEAVIILVSMIKNPAVSLKELSQITTHETGRCFDIGTVRRFLEHHGLLKKTVLTP